MAERTKLWIADAMKRILVKKPLEKIFVTDICKEAEIERPTFYYHFKDKYDLMAWIFCQQTMKTDVLSLVSAAKAMNGMRQEWLMHDNITPAETVVEMMFSSMPEGLKNLFFVQQKGPQSGS